jgi:hypothetical protein
LPIELFSKTDREYILRAWPPNSTVVDVVDESVDLSFPWRMNALDPAVISLKGRIMKRPTLYEVGS